MSGAIKSIAGGLGPGLLPSLLGLGEPEQPKFPELEGLEDSGADDAIAAEHERNKVLRRQASIRSTSLGNLKDSPEDSLLRIIASGGR